jgi:hypothetical protein
MTDAINPYQSPHQTVSEDVPFDRQMSSVDRFACIAWPIVFLLNIIGPAMIGWDITSQSGRSGMVAASLLLFISGWCACLARPSLGRKVVTGAVILAPSQLFPIIQIIAGIIGFWVAATLGLAKDCDDLPVHMVDEIGGFLVTLVVGAILIGVAAEIGVCLTWLSPQRRLSATGSARAL